MTRNTRRGSTATPAETEDAAGSEAAERAMHLREMTEDVVNASLYDVQALEYAEVVRAARER